MSKTNDLPEIVAKILKDRRRHRIDDPSSSHKHAAVLLPLFHENGEYKILFTKRTDNLETHKGQISLPGGVVDQDDADYKDTALREAQEEIGLRREDVTVLGQLDDAIALVSNFIIYPFVGVIPPSYNFRISHFEVERIIEVPLWLFFEDRPPVKKDIIEVNGMILRSPNWRYQDDVIWGATARIMENFVHIIGDRIDLSRKGE
jgi:8-oxo-dGTP pyrophosphatase MutT (NUDIX family)